MKRRIQKLESLTAWKALPDASEYIQVWAIDPDQDEAEKWFETRDGARVTDPKTIERLTAYYNEALRRGELNITARFDDYDDPEDTTGTDT